MQQQPDSVSVYTYNIFTYNSVLFFLLVYTMFATTYLCDSSSSSKKEIGGTRLL